MSSERAALVLMEDEAGRFKVVKACEGLGNRIEMARRQDEAIEKVKAVDAISVVVAEAGFMERACQASPLFIYS